MRILIFDAGRRNHTQTGYGTMSKQFGARLVNLGHEIYYHDEHNCPLKADLWLWIRPPHYVKYSEFNPDNCNVFFTMHEKDTLEGHKAEWPKLLNKCKAIITPTEWNRKVWIQNGVTVPVHTCPLGVDTKLYRGGRTYEFSMLSIFEGLGRDSSRESWKENIKAYFETFYDNQRNEVTYTIKSWNINWIEYNNYINYLVDKYKYAPNLLPKIQVLDLELVEIDLNNLYGKHWVFLKNSRGEGWSLPTLEAVSSGLRVIAKQLPVFEYLTEQNSDLFVHYKGLKQVIWENYKRWENIKGAVNQYHWKEATIKLNEVLKEINEQKKT